jgi:dihydroxyacetone kinase-like predicted kinase
VIRGDGLDVTALRDEFQALAESALVVGDESVVRVHGHTEDPGQLLTSATRHGRLQRISIEDMDAQHDEWLRTQVEAAEGAAEAADTDSAPGANGSTAAATDVATVAVAPGSGFARVFRSLGVTQVVAGGQTMNPSANDLLAAARRTRARVVIVLPNNGNVVMTAQQAASVAEGQRLIVVPSKTVPQGIAAQLAFSAEGDPEAIAAAMTDALRGVRTVEITRATRAVTLDGVAVSEGDLLGLLDDRLVAAGDDVLAVARQAMDGANAAGAEIVAVYRGEGVGESEAEAFMAALRAAYPQAEFELVAGGQPHYDYIISVE